ncbi:diaminopimelate epimerase [Comamonas denitrificans]|uniref:Diaminopimelate epimerase n=1 Tax=Comamonas denitrificans TaxID=117506 RepID=A0A939GZT2_9BURK|nr:diaminopimelate epimerase [Comamonas denitrificans]
MTTTSTTALRRPPLPFTKMHGLGNDFLVLDATRQPVALSPEDIRALADRHFGVGFDQLLVVTPGPRADVDFGYRIFNADGSEVEQCGNGARCFARFVHDQGLTDQRRIRVQTCAGTIVLHITDTGHVQVDMGMPRFLPQEIPFSAPAPALRYPVAVGDEMVQLAVVNMGNPHAVLRVADVDSAPVATLGPQLESHPRFPARVNVGFMQVLAPDRIRLRVYERGTGETLACGTGACAAVVAGQRLGWLGQHVTVLLPGGPLQIDWPGEGQHVHMQGPATRVYDGLWHWPEAAPAV